MSEEIRLVLPAQEDFRPIAHLVVGGLGARLDLTFEHLEDLQVAIEALLGCRDDDGDVTVAVHVDRGVLRATVGPLPGEALAELDADSGELGLRRVLETVCDAFDAEERDGGLWIDLTKQTAGAAAS